MNDIIMSAPDNSMSRRLICQGDKIVLSPIGEFEAKGLYAVMTFKGLRLIDYNPGCQMYLSSEITAVVGKVKSVIIDA